MPAAGQNAPDERPLWEMHRDGRFHELLDAIQGLQGKYPRWSAPKRLVDLAREGAFTKSVEDAVRASDHAALIALAAEKPEAFGCQRIDWAWALGEAYAQTRRQREAQALAERLLSRTCAEEHRLVTLYKARGWLAVAAWEGLLEREAALTHAPEIEEKLQKLRYDARVARFHATPDARSPEAFQELAAGVDRYQDAGTALSGAWLYFNRADIAQARRWFGQALRWKADSNDARYGLALCSFKEGRFDDALSEARALPSGHPDRERLMQEALLAKAGSEAEANRHAEAAALILEAAALGSLPRHGRTRYAWTLLQLGDAAGAARAFEGLYREQPDAESAHGLAISYGRAGKDLASLGALTENEPLATVVREENGRRMLDQKRFLSAGRNDPQIAGTLGSAGVAQFSLAGALREKSGSEGTSRLRRQLVPSIEAGMPFASDGEAFVRLDRVILSSGALPANAAVGSPPAVPGAYAFAPVTRVEGVEPRAFVRVERDAIWQLHLGMTPTGGPVSEHLFGRIERHAHASWGFYDLAAYAEPVRESILSYVGLRDPYGGASWGRVLRYGAEARSLWLMREGWALNAGARAEHIVGDGVADNDRVRAEAGFGRNLGLRGFDYAVLGIETSVDQYRRNLSPFTLGNGGYYSPQEVVRGGLALNFQSEERRPWIMRGRVSAGRARRVQDDAPRFPLASGGGTFPGSRDYGNDAEAEFSAVWQLTERVQAGAILARSTAPQYGSTTSGLVLRVLLESRNAVTSGDLPVRLLTDLR